ncbi:ribokinase [Sinirhodobacter populi]|uniref:Ribokinase n=1 Tax=Paenirhodobacter populi TaxID=2306993 RepID=A0A443K5G2_9RHOB|nr:PfkB family carbohydrate kinase [Sinirhodobacter populi]RWR27933.1 ribokinase [Sinirhodobacter populi]
MRAIVLGNLALDETFAVDTLPAPGASIAGRAMATELGGKGANQAIVLARALGAAGQVRFVAAIGEDVRGAELARRLTAEPLVADLFRRKGIASDLSVILRDASGENVVVTTQEAAHSITPAEATAVVDTAQAGDLLLMQGNLAPAATGAALRRAGECGLFRVLNPSPVEGCDGRYLALADLVVLNAQEARHFGPDLPARAQVLRTLGAQGAEIWQGGELVAAVAGQAVMAVDPTGAGDCFLGAALAAMMRRGARGLSAADLAFAARAAAITVSRLGTQSAFPTAEEFAGIGP